MDHIREIERPVLRDPVLISAFLGWNDASEVATSAAKHLIRQLGARKFASIIPEEFYVFTETRPNVRIDGTSVRRIEWPANDFYYAELPDADFDLIILVGAEPQLKWQTFSKAVFSIAKAQGTKLVVTLGGLLADVPHTFPPRLTGSASAPNLQRKLRSLRIRGSRYEGPTGILGVLGSFAREEKMESASIWGNVPHYISTTGNPKVSAAIVRQLGVLLDLPFDITELERLGEAFDQQVSQAISQNPEVADYVRHLEDREGPGGERKRDSERDEESGSDGGEDKPQSQPELPSSEILIRELEEFLKRRPTDDGEGDDRG